MAENVFVMTATNRLMSQKFKTMMAIMKKKHETKNSESIREYINGVHCRRKLAMCTVDTGKRTHTPLAVAIIITWSAEKWIASKLSRLCFGLTVS